jgi:hypothetical protein
MASEPPTFSVRGSLDVLQTATLHGDVDALGSLKIGGSTTIDGTLVVTGACNLAGTVFASTTDPLNLNTVNAVDLTVSDAFTTTNLTSTLHSSLSTLTVDSTTALNAALTAYKSVTLGSTAADAVLLKGSATCEQTLACAGLASLQGGLNTTALQCSLLTASSATTLGSTAHIIGAVTLDSALGCAGLSTLAALQVNGPAAFAQNVSIAAGKTLTAAGPVIASSSATVGGALTAASGLSVSSGLTAVQSLTAASTAAFAGNVSLANGASLTVGTAPTALAGSFTVSGPSTLAATSVSTLTASATSSLAGLSVSQAATFASAVTASSSLDVLGISRLAASTWSGTTTFNNDSTWTSGHGLTVTDAVAAFGGAVNVAGLTTLSGNAVLPSSSSLTVGGALTVAGSSAVQSLSVATALTCAAGSTASLSALHAASAVLDGSLTAAGASSFGSTLQAAGLHSTAAVLCDTTLAVLGSTALTGSLTANASSAFNAGATVLGGLTSDTATVATATIDTLSVANLTVGSGFSSGASASTVNGDLIVKGFGTFDKDVTVDVAATLSVLGSLSVHNVTAAAGATSALVNLSTSGTATFASSHVAGSETVDGAFSAASISTTGAVTAASCTAAAVTSSGALQAATLQISGASVLHDAQTQKLHVQDTLTVDDGFATSVSSLTVRDTGAFQKAVTVASNLTVAGSTQLQALQTTAATASTLTVTGAASAASVAVAGALTVAGPATLQAVTSGTITSSGDLKYAGALYQNTFPIRFGPYGADFNPPQIYILPARTVVASQIQLTLDPVQQHPLGVWGIMLPQVTSLTISVQVTTASDVALVLAVLKPELITKVTLFCYGQDETQLPSGITGKYAAGSSTAFEVYGLAPATQYTVGLYYSNDVASSATFYETGLNMHAAGAPAAPTIAVSANMPETSHYEEHIFTMTAGITDAVNPADSPQPDVSRFEVSYLETSSIGDHATPDSGSVVTKTYSTPAQLLQCATVYTASAYCYNKVLASTASPQSNTVTFYTQYTDSRFLKGLTLTDAAALPAPSVRFPAAQYISRSNVLLASTDVLAAPAWSLTLTGLRLNYEPHPAHGQTVATWTVSVSGAESDTAAVVSKWSDTTARTATSSLCALTVAAPVDANTGGEVGFFRTVPTIAVQLSALTGSYTAYQLQFTQQLRQAGDWSYSAGAVSYVPAAEQLYTHSNATSFYVADTAAAPTVTAVTEKSTARTAAASVLVSGLPTLPQSLSAISTVIAVAVQNVGRFWFQIGSVATAASSSNSVTGSTSNTTTACAAIYSDVLLTAAIDPAAALTQSTVYYRSVPVVLNTSALAGLQVYDLAAFTATAANIIGSSAAFASNLLYFRFDSGSLQHPHITSTVGRSAQYGERVLLSDNTNAYSAVTGAVTYDHSQVIVGNSSNVNYNTAAGLYAGLYSGAAGSWANNWTARKYRMDAASSPFPDYSSPSAAARYATFRYPGVSSAVLFQHILVTLDGATDVNDPHDILYKYVDDVNGSATTPWKNLLIAATGPITAGTDGDGGRYASFASKVVTSTTVPVNDSGTIYIRIALPASSVFQFKGVSITDFTTGAALAVIF